MSFDCWSTGSEFTPCAPRRVEQGPLYCQHCGRQLLTEAHHCPRAFFCRAKGESIWFRLLARDAPKAAAMHAQALDEAGRQNPDLVIEVKAGGADLIELFDIHVEVTVTFSAVARSFKRI